MSVSARLVAASRAAGQHFAVSVLLALIVASVVFVLWYPPPYSDLAGGTTLFLLVTGVDVICGPLLTWVVFDPRKPRRELVRDLVIIVVLQLSALGYGLWTVASARPIHMAYEGDRFRLVMAPDIDPSTLSEAPAGLDRLGWTGPTPIGVRLAKSSDPDFPRSIQLSLEGLHPSYRPSRWRPYADQQVEAGRQAVPLERLRERYPEESGSIDGVVRDAGAPMDALGYLPLLGVRSGDWVVIVNRSDGQIRGYLPLDGWAPAK